MVGNNMDFLPRGCYEEKRAPLALYRLKEARFSSCSAFHYMQLVTPRVVAIAVRMLMAICRMVFHAGVFMLMY